MKNPAIHPSALSLVVAMAVLVPPAVAKGGKGHSGGHAHGGAKPHAAPHHVNRPPKPAHAAAKPKPPAAHPRPAMPRPSKPHPATARPTMPRPTVAGRGGRYAYGARHGYRRGGYRGRYSSSNRNAMLHRYTRAIVAQLRSTHARLARLDRDYQGHRVRALHAISMAIRQLGHRSGRSLRSGRAGGLMGFRNAGRARGKVPMSQAASDAHMRTAMHSLHGVAVHLSNLRGSRSHARAFGSVQRGIRELAIALRVR